MTQMNELKEQLKKNYSNCICTVTKASDNMCRSNKHVFDFDQVTENIYGKNNKPKSADALFFYKNLLVIAEFKGGMRDKKKPDDRALAAARKAEKKEQRTSLYAKGLDTYLILEHDLALKDSQKILFIAVIDNKEVDPMDEAIATYFEEANGSDIDTSDIEIVNLKKSLKHLKRRQSKNSYLYHEIDVMSADRFVNEYCLPAD